MSTAIPVDQNFSPILFKRGNSKGDALFEELTSSVSTQLLDLFVPQKKELFKIRSPKTPLTANDLDNLFDEWGTGRTMNNEGTWAYYPWSGRLLHLLDKDEFIELRTNRNHYKIAPGEQDELATRRLGIIGLSVGHAVAINIATERICGRLKLADFDSIELSNLNRIKTGIHNIGINKCIVTAREIAEIDPFIEIECFTEGLHEQNIEAFLLDGGKLDILIDECDGIDMKILCRQQAQKYGIPVVMETSDRGMLDVERFDKNPERPIFHGLLGNSIPTNLSNLSTTEKIPIVLKIVDVKNGSLRGKTSMIEVGQSISSWPQLASAVSLGGGVVTDVCRRMLLRQFEDSGRYYVDLEQLIGKKTEPASEPPNVNPYQPFDLSTAMRIIDSLSETNEDRYSIDNETISQIVNAACYAPSTGNDQPWKWVLKNHRLYLFHDQYRSFSFGDFDTIASDLSFGAATENLELQSAVLGYSVTRQIYPLGNDSTLIATFDFAPFKVNPESSSVFSIELADQIFTRTTNRNLSQPIQLSDADLQLLRAAAESIEGASAHFITDRENIDALGKIIGECDRVRLLNESGHADFVYREMRWTPQDAETTRDGIDVRTLGLAPAEVGALAIVKDYQIAKTLKEIEGGNALIEAAVKTAATTSCMAIITLPRYNRENFFLGGISLQRLWLQAEKMNLAVHPLISPFYLFPRILHGHGAGLDESEIRRLESVRQKFLSILPLESDLAEVFICKIAKAEKPTISTYRLPLNETLFFLNN
jgi:molybdopterin/thiamine biosynthesis adenylyltransferase